MNAGIGAADESSRLLVRESLDRTLMLEAGAGTGKTRALVDRVLALVAAGIPIDRLVVITFTDRAAAELRERVRSGLESTVEIQDGLARERTTEALRSIDRAQISTIHAFCMTTLKSFAPEAGIDPAFTLMEEIEAGRRFEEQWRLFLNEMGADAARRAAFDRVLRLGLGPRDLQNLAFELGQRPELTGRIDLPMLTSEEIAWPNLELMRADLEALRIGEVDPADRLRLRAEPLLRLVERLAVAGDGRDELLAAAAPDLEGSFSGGTAAAWNGRIGDARSTFGDVAKYLRETLAAARSAALAGLLPPVIEHVRAEAARRGREGRLIFDDLIRGTRGLLREHPEALAALRRRYDAMLIDEFQDTDPIQVEIATLLSRDDQALVPGRLFVVGDPKQSIYRFRRADMEVYAATLAEVSAAGGTVAPLAMNRRSSPAIVAWVNDVFAGAIGRGEVPSIQPAYVELVAYRDDSPAGPGVALLGGPAEGRASEVREQEARDVASAIGLAVAEGWEVTDRSGATRPAAFRDIAILVPTRASLLPLERWLNRHEIRHRVEGGSLIFRTQEVRDLVNCLAAIDDPADEVAIVASLRSPAFGCSDVDLGRHAAGGGRFNYLRPVIVEGAVAGGLQALARLHHKRHDLSLAALVERVAAELGLAEIGVLGQASRNAFRRVRYVVEQARLFEAVGPQSLRSFVAWLERRADNEVLDQEGAGLDDDEDAVRILTVHGAKGLEFPIVFACGFGSAPMTRSPVIGVDAHGEPAVVIGAKGRNAQFTLGDVESMAARERQHTDAELRRVLYVAATRARDHLIFSLYHPTRALRSGARILLEAGAAVSVPVLEVPSVEPAEREAPFAQLAVDLPDGLTPTTFAATRAALVVAASRWRHTSATELGALAKPEASDESEPWARGRAATRVGRAVHAAIQSARWDATPGEVGAIAAAQAVAQAIPDRAPEVAALVSVALATKAAGRARLAPRALREVPFAFEHGGMLVEGFIDLVIEGPDGIEIVDWKTDHVAPSEVPKRLEAYRTQAGLYLLGIEAATGRKVVRVTYVFVAARVEESPGDPVALAAFALDTLGDGSTSTPLDPVEGRAVR